MKTVQFLNTNWQRVESSMTKEIKEVLALPLKSSCSYLFGDSMQGACGIPEISKDALVDTAFKLLSSKDEEVVVKALAYLTRTVCHRIHRDPTNADLRTFLSGSMEGEFKNSSNTLRNTWTLARFASRSQSITWTFVDDEPSVSFDCNTIIIAGRRKLLKTFHQAQRLQHTEALINQRSQGKAIECAAAHPASTHFLYTGKYTRFADWRFVHKARLKLLPLNGAKQWTNAASRKCRRCGYQNETLPHVLNHCGSHQLGVNEGTTPSSRGSRRLPPSGEKSCQ
ncbi:reverse transcriptase domain-containing protein [Trichonephila inaurata madagascariensis]|uniref:Reverse transcriptase domain-containing protein n=1 Tax=Trichonephila inaurata madagascariensis TaxID=2747483 RepID=A0A8X6XPI6_9ARAC|nr:reverse transcriptase domain-containing protein [Trichonephila inaurata madagascariensis]